MRSSDARRTRPGALSPGVLVVALAAALACVTAFLVTSALVDDEDPADRPDPAATGAVRCWDGTSAEARGDCSRPDASRAAFAWVFPDVDLAPCSRRVTAERTIVKCYLGDVEMNLSRWDSTAEGITYYRDEMRGPGEVAEGGRRVWTASTVRFGLTKQKSAVMYDAAPWSLTTYADSPAEVVRAQRSSWMRPVAQLRSTPR